MNTGENDGKLCVTLNKEGRAESRRFCDEDSTQQSESALLVERNDTRSFCLLCCSTGCTMKTTSQRTRSSWFYQILCARLTSGSWNTGSSAAMLSSHTTFQHFQGLHKKAREKKRSVSQEDFEGSNTALGWCCCANWIIVCFLVD